MVSLGIEPGTIHSVVVRSTNYSTVPLLQRRYFPRSLIR